MTTYPNQKVIVIQKKKYQNNFLQIGNEEWVEASNTLKASSFRIYLYLASNCDGFEMGLSQKAIEEKLNIKKTAYYDSVKELEEKGYITLMCGNRYLFHTTPFRKNGKILSEDSENPEIEMIDFSGKTDTHSGKTDTGVRKNGREIDNIDNIDFFIDKGSTPLTRSEPVRPQAGEPKGKGMEGTRADTIEKLLEDREVYLLTSKSGEAHEYTFKDFYEEVAGSSENLENIIDAWKRGIERTQENKRKF